MSRPDPPPRPGRLAAVLGPPAPGGRWAPAARRPGPVRADEPPTVPLAIVGVAGEPRAVDQRIPARGPGSRLRQLLPVAWRTARIDPGRPGATALALVAAAAAVVAAVGVWTERPRAEPVGGLPAVSAVAEAVPESTTGGGPEAGPAAAAATPGAPLVVSVSGKVQRPGLVEVPDGARVADALQAAGGALPGTDLTALNLARRVTDGEQVAVGVPAAPDAAPGPGATPGGAGGGGSGSAAGAPAGKVDLNAATPDQLDALPGVGPVTAQRILEWRTRNGRFARLEQLREVEGIGERRFAQLRELVTV